MFADLRLSELCFSVNNATVVAGDDVFLGVLIAREVAVGVCARTGFVAHKPGEEFDDGGFEHGETGADYADVGFEEGPGVGSRLVVYGERGLVDALGGRRRGEGERIEDVHMVSVALTAGPTVAIRTTVHATTLVDG